MPKYCEKFKKGSLEMLFLKLLSEGDFYGYELAKLFNHLSNNVITLSAGNMSPALYRLKDYKSVVNATNAIINFHKEQLEEMVL